MFCNCAICAHEALIACMLGMAASALQQLWNAVHEPAPPAGVGAIPGIMPGAATMGIPGRIPGAIGPPIWPGAGCAGAAGAAGGAG
jgi:hypothetical protein